MIDCSACGFQNEDDDGYCGQCGTKLKARVPVGAAIGAGGPALPPPAPAATSEADIAVETAAPTDEDDRVSVELAAQAKTEAAGRATAEPEAPATTKERRVPEARPETAGSGSREVDVTDPKAAEGSATVAVGAAATPGRRPQPSAPGRRPEPPLAHRRAPAGPPPPPDKECASCHQPNQPSRQFCKRCGDSLFNATIKSPKFVAGTRPKLDDEPKHPLRFVDRIRRLAPYWRAAVALLGALLLLGPFRQPINRQLSKLSRHHVYAPARPIEMSSNRIFSTKKTVINPDDPTKPKYEDVPHDGVRTSDRDTNSYWSAEPADHCSTDPESKEPLSCPSLTATFDGSVDLDRLGIYSGAGEDEFTNVARPRDILLTYEYAAPASKPGEQAKEAPPSTSEKIKNLLDKPDEQTRDLHAKHGVKRVTIQITRSYRALPAGRNDVAIAEIEFFDKQ